MNEGSVIGIRNVPCRYNLKSLAKVLGPHIRDKFVVLQFEQKNKGNNATKIAYVRLPPELNPMNVIRIVSGVRIKNCALEGFMPSNIPAAVLSNKGRTIAPKMARRLKVNLEDRPDVVFIQGLSEILREMQAKYMRLYWMSRGMGKHKLMRAVSEAVYDRMKVLVPQMKRTELSSYNLSRIYRAAYPHSGDYQLIVSCLHQVEEELGRPHTEMTEVELLGMERLLKSLAEKKTNISLPELNGASFKYMDPIVDKIVKHLGGLNVILAPSTEEEFATLKVRQELQKVAPVVGQIVREFALRDLKPRLKQVYNMRIYGEPYLPGFEQYNGFVRSFYPTQVERYKRAYNCLWVKVTRDHYERFLKADGTKIANATLICRPSSIHYYSVSDPMIAKIKALYNVASGAPSGAPV